MLTCWMQIMMQLGIFACDDEPETQLTNLFAMLYLTLQKDLERALSKTRPSVGEGDIAQYEKFTNDFGQEG